MKKNKKILKTLSFLFSSLTLTSLPIVAVFNNISTNNNSLTSSLYGWGSSGSSSTETQATFSFKSEQEITSTPELHNFKPKYANEFTNEELKLFLKPNSSASNWTVEIQDLTDTQIFNGEITFKVIQNLRQSDGSYTRVEIQNSNSSSSGSDNTIWNSNSSNELKKYILSSKYKFEWANEEEMKIFYENNNILASELTEEIVKNNLISLSSSLPENYTVQISDVDSDNSSGNYGVKKVTINFDSSQDEKWASGKKPNSTETEKIFRGFKPEPGYDNQFILEFTDADIGSIKIQNKDIYGDLLKKDFPEEVTLNMLTPSQFVNVVENNKNNNVLYDLLTKGTGLEDNTVFVKLKYMGIDVTDSSFASKTGLTDTQNKYKIKKIRTIPNDTDGSLIIIYSYTAIDPITLKDVEKEEKWTVPAGTFKTSQDADKVLNFSWYYDDYLSTIGTSFDIVNSFKNNSNNEAYVKALSNQFFFGTKETYAQKRIVSIDYTSGGTDSSEGYVSDSQDTNIKVEIVFPEWAGATYVETDTDGNSVTKKGFKAEKVFNVGKYLIGSSSGSVNDGVRAKWVPQQSLLDKNPSFPYLYPTEVVQKVLSKNGEYKETDFFKLEKKEGEDYKYNTVFIPNDADGSIRILITVISNDSTTQKEVVEGYLNQVYVGFKKNLNATDGVIEFSWLPNSEVSLDLLSIPINEVTNEDVIEFYLNQIPLFANKTLTEDNVQINKTKDSKGIWSIEIIVEIPMFEHSNSSVGDTDRRFKTKISGFVEIDSKIDSNIIPPVDDTALIAIISSSAITTLLVFAFISMVSNRSKYRQFDKKEKNKKDLRIKK